MEISNDIMKMVERREEYKKNFNRCLSASICPKCGKKLRSRDMGGENLIEIEYKCTNPDCQFTYPRIEA